MTTRRMLTVTLFLNKIQYPSRGAIYDRTGKLLVFNQPAYDITIVPKEIENLDTLDLCQSLNITRAQFLKIMSDMKDRRPQSGLFPLYQPAVYVATFGGRMWCLSGKAV